MTLSDITLKIAEPAISSFCKSRSPEKLKDQIRITYKIPENSITIYEERVYFKDSSKWSKSQVAQFRFDDKSLKWELYCSDRNSKWFSYIDTNPERDINKLIKEVDEDPTGIFWG
jgi:hypothetical protein